MKSFYWIFIVLVISISCNNQPIEKPDNLIDEQKMTNILYDLTVLDAMKSQSPFDSVTQSIRPKEYIYKKYKIDSLQFVLSNQYYISQIETYKKMYESINERLQKEKTANETLLKKSETTTPPIAPQADMPQVR
jgi:hypothetical protein